MAPQILHERRAQHFVIPQCPFRPCRNVCTDANEFDWDVTIYSRSERSEPPLIEVRGGGLRCAECLTPAGWLGIPGVKLVLVSVQGDKNTYTKESASSEKTVRSISDGPQSCFH